MPSLTYRVTNFTSCEGLYYSAGLSGETLCRDCPDEPWCPGLHCGPRYELSADNPPVCRCQLGYEGVECAARMCSLHISIESGPCGPDRQCAIEPNFHIMSEIVGDCDADRDLVFEPATVNAFPSRAARQSSYWHPPPLASRCESSDHAPTERHLLSLYAATDSHYNVYSNPTQIFAAIPANLGAAPSLTRTFAARSTATTGPYSSTPKTADGTLTDARACM